MKYVTSFIGASRGWSTFSSCKSQPCNTSSKEKISTNCVSEWMHSSYYPWEKSSVKFPQITHTHTHTHTVDQRSESNLQEVRQQETRGPDHDPTDETPGQIIYTAFGHFHCCGGRRETWPLAPGFITAAQLGSHAESQFSVFCCLIFYSLF